MKRIRLLLVDDSELFLRSARNFLAENLMLDICGVAGSVAEALPIASTGTLDLVIMDINMPRQSGLEGAKLLKAMPAPPRVVLISLAGSPDMVTVALENGADGFVAKSSIGTELVPLIMSLCADQSA